MTRDDAIRTMIDAVTRGEARQFYLGVVGYYVETFPMSADGLAVDATTVERLQQTADGFTCETFFPARNPAAGECPRANR